MVTALAPFSSPPNPDEFRLLVWKTVQQIPPGCVSTYGQIARMIPAPGGISGDSYRSLGPRWVGGAMAACPQGVPWQRVVNSQGKISLRGESAVHQKELLEAEGIEFSPAGKIDLQRFGWQKNINKSTLRFPGF